MLLESYSMVVLTLFVKMKPRQISGKECLLMSALCYTSCPVAAPSSQTMKATAAGCEILTLTPHPHTLKSSDNGAKPFFLFSLILPEALASVLQTLQTAFAFL